MCLKYKQLMEEQEEENKSLRKEIEMNKENALQQLSMDDQTKKIIQDLKDENDRYNVKNIELKNTVSTLQNTINSITSEFEQFRQTISRNLRSKIRPSVVSMEKDYDGLQQKYDDLESKFRQVIIVYFYVYYVLCFVYEKSLIFFLLFSLTLYMFFLFVFDGKHVSD